MSKKQDLEELIVTAADMRKRVSLVALPSAQKGSDMDMQKRAVAGIDRFLSMDGIGANDFNCFVCGVDSREDIGPVADYIRDFAQDGTIPGDILYVHNFDGDLFRHIKVPAGQGKALIGVFNKINDEGVLEYRTRLDEYLGGVRKAKLAFAKDKLDDIQKEAGKLGFEFQIDILCSQIEDYEPDLYSFSLEPGKFKPNIDFKGRFMLQSEKDAELKRMIKEEDGFEENYTKLKDMLRQVLFQVSYQSNFNEAKKKAHETALGSFGRFIDVCFMDESIMPSLGSMDDDSTLSRYIKWVKKNQLDTIEKRAVTPSPSSKPLESPASMMSNLQSILREYRMKQVNILVDNSETKGKPVIIPEKYSLEDLFGYYNDESSFNIFAKENPEKDHTKYVAGEFHKADGGYLVLDTMKLLRSMSFSKVLDVLEKGRLDIPERRWFFGRENSMTEEVSIDTRVVLYGSTHLWYALNFYVSDFKRFFKSSAQFVTRERIDTALHEVAANIYSYAKKTDGILPLDMSALEAILEEGIRESGNQQKIIVKSDMYHDLVRLSDIQAKKDDAKAIQRKHVSEVINQSRYLNGTISDLIDDAIIEGTIMTEFDGEKKGQVNGLYVSGFVEMYGKPGRITARVAVGGKGIHSIDQDIGKTGPSFKKSIATLSSILSGIVSDEKELALKLSASISFEQSYNGLDGDSATIAQLVALISAISGVEVKQSIAVTGSADQYGNAQAIGGVNYKVEGFYELCRKKGEHYGKGGEYGVVIPRSNVKHLQLREELVEDKDNFRIYAVDTIQQACEVLMGKEWNYIQEKLFDGAQRYFDASKENDVKETLAVETGGRPDDTDDLEALLHDPVALSDLADKYGIQKEMTVDGNSLAMDPGVRLAMAYAIHADAMENVKGFLKP